MPATYSQRFIKDDVTLSSGGIPSAPFGLGFGTVNTNSIQLNWTNADTKETSIEVQYRGSDDNWTALITLDAGTETYTNGGLSSNVARAYRVRAVNASGNSPWSNIAINATTDSGAVLHTTDAWQRVLRAWMGGFVSADFDVTLSPTITDFSSMSDEEVWQAWYVTQNRGIEGPNTNGFREASGYFVLSAIENGGTINMRVGGGGLIDPVPTAFWAHWDNPWNARYDVPEVYLRALVAVAVDMIEATYLNATNGSFRRSDFTGGWLRKWSLPLWMHENHSGTDPDLLDENTRWAFKEGIRRMWDKTISYDPSGAGGGDLEGFQLQAMPYMYSLGIITLDEYKERANKIFSKIVNPRGGKGYYHDHGGWAENAIDIAYEGIWHVVLADAAVAERFLLPDVHIIRDAAQRSYEMMAHMTFIDYAPDTAEQGPFPFDNYLGRLIGPSHFNNGTPGSLGFQWEYMVRYWDGAYLFDDMKYHLCGWHRTAYFIPQKEVLNRTDMIGFFGLTYATTLGFNDPTRANNGVQALTSATPAWDFRYFGGAMWQLAIHGVSGLWTSLKAARDAGTDENIVLPPILRTADYIKNYNHLVIGKVGNYSAMTHNGPIRSEWANNPSALRGGISAFWIKDRAVFILGIGTGGQDNNPDDWDTHDTWAVNTVSGTTSGGKFSEARYLNQGLALTGVNLVNKVLTFTNNNYDSTTDLSALFKSGDKVAFEDWNNGNTYYLTLVEDGTYDIDNEELRLVVLEDLHFPATGPYGGVVFPVNVETGSDYFIQETRTLIDSTKAATTADSATIEDLVVKRIIRFDETGVSVDLELTSPGESDITEIWEQIPVYQGKSGDTYDIEYWNGSWTQLSTTYVSSQYVRLTRDVQVGGGDVYAYIVFQNPQRIKLSSAQVAPGTDTDYVRNLKIQISDILPEKKKLSYVLQKDSPTQ